MYFRLVTNRPQTVIFGIKLLWGVRSMSFENSIRRPGIKVNTERILKSTALIRTTPRSMPMPNCMNIMAARPARVVRQLEEISGIALLKARIQAVRVSAVSFSSLNRWHRIMA